MVFLFEGGCLQAAFRLPEKYKSSLHFGFCAANGGASAVSSLLRGGVQAVFWVFRRPESYTNSGKCRCSCSGVRLGAISSSSSSQATATKSGATSLVRSKSSVARRQARGKHWRKRSYKLSQSTCKRIKSTGVDHPRRKSAFLLFQ